MAYLVLVVVTLGYIYLMAPALRSALFSPVVVGLVVLTLVLAGIYAVAMRQDRYRSAFAGVAGLVFAIVGVVARLMYPMIDRAAGLSVDAAIVSTLPLNLMTLGVAVLLPLILLYFGILYSVFSGPIEAVETY